MLRFLMRDQDLQVIKVPLAVIAPRAVKNLFEIGVAALFLTHGGWGMWLTGL